MVMDELTRLQQKLDGEQGNLRTLDSYFMGTQPASYLSTDAQAALQGRLRVLSVNYPRLLVNSIAERLQVTGFREYGAEDVDSALWRAWDANDLDQQSHLAHIDALAYGRSFVIVWADKFGNPRVTVESPEQMTALHDPATGQLYAAYKQWTLEDGVTVEAVRYDADQIIRYSGTSGAVRPVDSIPNPLGVVPVVELINKRRLLDLDGDSEFADIVPLVDALNKIMSDAMVTSEYFARPRRWVTGLEVMEDDDGNPINPFTDSPSRVWQSEDPDTKFRQFASADLSSYSTLTATITQQIGAISGLPPHYLGLNGDQPPSADSIRSAEASLVARCIGHQRTFGAAWAQVAQLISLVSGNVQVPSYETLWASAETRTPAQAADAAAKLVGMGVPLTSALSDPLGYSPSQIQQIQAIKKTEPAPVPVTTGGNSNE